MIFVIGDIHGEISKLRQLINSIFLIAKNPEFVFIGDYIDKGEDALKTLTYLADLKTKYDCTFLCGNHEYLWLKLEKENFETMDYLLKYGAKKTMDSFNVRDIFQAKQKIMDAFSDFFLSLKPYWSQSNYIAVHSGINPRDYNTPIDLIDISRLIFNRYDFIKVNRYYLDRYIVIFGHTGFYSPYVDSYKVGIDTSACYMKNQPLTAYSPDHNLFIDSNNNNYLLKTISQNYCPNIPRIKPEILC